MIVPSPPQNLWPHPTTACPDVLALHARVSGASGGAWHLRFELAADLGTLRVPAADETPGARDQLWRHTCFEAFVGQPDSSSYHEFNFSPAGHWAAWRFGAERVRHPDAPALPAPRLECNRTDRRLTLDAWLPASALPDGNGECLLGLCAVVESANGRLSYWALAHPRAKPDFHDRRGWLARGPTTRDARP